MQILLGYFLNIVATTFLVCAVVTLFSALTMRYWSSFFKFDLLVFWLASISRQIGKVSRKDTNLLPKQQWKDIYESLSSDPRDN